jgi:hypothetical protein
VRGGVPAGGGAPQRRPLPRGADAQAADGGEGPPPWPFPCCCGPPFVGRFPGPFYGSSWGLPSPLLASIGCFFPPWLYERQPLLAERRPAADGAKPSANG